MKSLFTRLFLVSLFFHFINARSDFKPTPIKEMNLERFYYDTSSRTYLLSFPISGNTWLRYCIEFLTKRPTLQKYHSIEYVAKIGRNVNCPLGYTFDLGTDMSLPCIWKVHDHGYLKSLGGYNGKNETLIFLLRNPKEVLLRNYRGDAHKFKKFFADNHGKNLLSQKDLRSNNLKQYFENLRIYDQWSSEKRILIHYEDLIERPREVFYQLLTFLCCEDNHVDSFFEQYDEHKKRVISIYNKQLPGSVTSGNDILYYSKQIDPDERKRMDKTIEKTYPYLWNTYLKKYYSENALYEQKLYD